MSEPVDDQKHGVSELEELLELLDHVTDRLPSVMDGVATGQPAGAVSDSPVAGCGGEATENRAVRHARSTFARYEAERLGAELTDLRGRLRSAADAAAQATWASRQARTVRSVETRDTADVPEPTSSTTTDGSGGGVGAGLAVALDAAARRLLAGRDDPRPESEERTLQLIVTGAIESVPHVQRAGISLVNRDGVIASRAPSDPVVAALDELQNTLREGPCREAVVTAEHILIDDMTEADGRWPRFGPAARSMQAHAMLSFPLFAQHDGTAGALNLYSDTASVFDQSSIDTGSLFASHAALALHGARRVEQLNEALGTRDLIGQAKGILSERHGLTGEEAFALLVSSSQDTNLKLRDVARWVVSETSRRTGQ